MVLLPRIGLAASLACSLAAVGCAATDDANANASANADAPETPTAEDDITRARVYECKDDRGNGVGAILSFNGRTLKSATLKKIPYRGFKAEQVFGAAEASTGRNSEQEFVHVQWPVPTDEGELEAEVSFLSKTKSGSSWKTLPLDESLLGENHAVDGTPYGKLRVDVTIPWLDIEGDVGSTWFMYCTKK